MVHTDRDILLLHNPVAGRRYKETLQRFLHLMESRGYRVRVQVTTQRGDAREIARSTRKTDIIIAAGGDGTVHEVVDGLIARPVETPMPVVGFLPLGTANVLAWELNLPRSPERLVDLIEQGTICETRPGVGNGQCFFLMASVGLDARAVAAVNGTAKRFLGGGAYMLAAIQALRQPAPTYTVTIDSQTYQARTVIATRARRYAGPFVLAPNAGFTQPDLHVVMMKDYGFLATLRYGMALARGAIHERDDISIVAGQHVHIDGPEGDPIQMDGDVVGMLPLDLSVSPRIIRFLAPGD